MELYCKEKYYFRDKESLQRDIIEYKELIENKIAFAEKYDLNILSRRLYISDYSVALYFDYQKDSDNFTNTKHNVFNCNPNLMTNFSIIFYSVIENVNVIHKQCFYPDFDIADKDKEFPVLFIDKYDYFDEKTNNDMFNILKNNILATDNCEISKNSYNYEKFNLICENKIFI